MVNRPIWLVIARRLLAIISGLILCLILLELGLRAAGSTFLSRQEHKSGISARQKEAYSIMCVGDCITSQGGEYSYPSQLQKILNRRGIGVKFSVMNKGIPGVRSGDILGRLEANLDAYRPDMVIAMMGFNDKELNAPFGKVPGQSNSATPKKRIPRIYIEGQDVPLSELLSELEKDIKLDPENASLYVELGWLYRLQVKSSEAEAAFKKALALNPGKDGPYIGLGTVYEQQRRYADNGALFEKAVAVNPRNDWAYFGLGQAYRDLGRLPEAEAAFKKAIELNPENDMAYRALKILYVQTGNLQLNREYDKKLNELRSNCYAQTAVDNYHKLKDILDKRGIVCVCAQYPLRSIKPLREIFRGEDQDIIFVDNQKVFQDAVELMGYDEYFTDKFGGDFGHCAPKGNRLLAENIAEAISRRVFPLKSRINKP